MRIGGFQLSWLRRRWWLIVVSVLGVVAIALALRPPASTTFTGEALLLVRSGATDSTPGNASGANQLAVTYAGLIPHDAQVLDRVARSLNTTRQHIETHVSVINDASTSILRVKYIDSDAQTAVNGARAFADALAGPMPASSNFSGLALSRLPDSAHQNSSTNETLPVAVILGLCLGIVLVLAWERSDGRIDAQFDLEHETGVPVTALEGLSTGTLLAMLERWCSIAGVPNPSVAVVSASDGHRALTADVAEVFTSTASEGEAIIDLSKSSFQALSLQPGGMPGSWEVGERLAQHADVTVLVVVEGASISKLRKSISALEHFDIRPAWILYATDRVVASAEARRSADAPLATEAGATAPAAVAGAADLPSMSTP